MPRKKGQGQPPTQEIKADQFSLGDRLRFWKWTSLEEPDQILFAHSYPLNVDKKPKLSCGAACIHWTGALTEDGYPRFSFKGGTIRANRVAVALREGSIAANMEAAHTCAEHSCVNPGHLFSQVAKDNRAEMINRIERKKLLTGALEIIQDRFTGHMQRIIGQVLEQRDQRDGVIRTTMSRVAKLTSTTDVTEKDVAMMLCRGLASALGSQAKQQGTRLSKANRGLILKLRCGTLIPLESLSTSPLFMEVPVPAAYPQQVVEDECEWLPSGDANEADLPELVGVGDGAAPF